MSFISQGVRDAPELGVGPARRSRRCILLHQQGLVLHVGFGPGLWANTRCPGCGRPCLPSDSQAAFCWQAAFQLNAGGGWLQGRARWHHLLFHELAK